MAKIKVSEKFSWDTANLNEYIRENSDNLATRLVGEARTARMLRTIDGIKHKELLPDLYTDVDYQSAADCGFNPTGEVVFAKKEIEVAPIKVEFEFCNKDLINFFPRYDLRAGTNAELEELPYASVIMDDILAKNALKMDSLLWKGDKLSMNANLNKIDGLIKQLTAGIGNGVIALNTGALTGITASNAITAFLNAEMAIPHTLASDERFAFMAGYETMRKLQMNLLTQYGATGSTYITEELVDGQKKMNAIEIPGTFHKVWYAPGLNGTDYIAAGLFGGNGEYILGTDLASDMTTIDSDYDKKEQSLWLRLQFRIGTTFRFNEHCGLFIPAAS
jgi:hypothetical protein